jgi:hypothetical protein
MLGKVALALGLRRAFPGIVPGDIDDTDDEMPGLDEPPPAARATYADAETMIAEDHRTFLNYALDRLGPGAKAWLLPVKNADKIPSVAAPYFKVAHRDRLTWHILHAQQVTELEPEGDADEPVPADVHDDTEPA